MATSVAARLRAEGIGTEILGAFAPGPQAGLVSDFTYGDPSGFAGNALYASSLGSTVRVGNVSDINNMIVTPQFGGAFCFITGVSIDTSNLANETIFIGSDCTQGSINGAAAIWKVTPQPPAGAPPAVPSAPTATNATPGGALVGTALVSWIPASNGQALTGFLIRTVLASDGVTCAFLDPGNPANPAANACLDQVVNPSGQGVPPNSAQVTDLPIGTPVQFLVCRDQLFRSQPVLYRKRCLHSFRPDASRRADRSSCNSRQCFRAGCMVSPSQQWRIAHHQLHGYCNAQWRDFSRQYYRSGRPNRLNFTGLTNGSLYNFSSGCHQRGRQQRSVAAFQRSDTVCAGYSGHRDQR